MRRYALSANLEDISVSSARMSTLKHLNGCVDTKYLKRYNPYEKSSQLIIKPFCLPTVLLISNRGSFPSVGSKYQKSRSPNHPSSHVPCWLIILSGSLRVPEERAKGNREKKISSCPQKKKRQKRYINIKQWPATPPRYSTKLPHTPAPPCCLRLGSRRRSCSARTWAHRPD